MDPKVDNMIYLPEDPQSDFEFIAVRSHVGVIIKVVLTSLEVCVQHATPSLAQVVLSVSLCSRLCVILSTITTQYVPSLPHI